VSDEPETEGEPPATLGSVLDGSRLDDASARMASLKIDVKPRWLAAGGALFIDLPRRLTCATCDGGGCSRCKNSGGYRLTDSEERSPLRIEIAGTEREAMRIRAPLGESLGVDGILLEIVSAESPSSFVRYQGKRVQIMRPAPAASVTPVGIISTVVGLFALILTIVLALVMRS